jgi:hypothetical protein
MHRFDGFFKVAAVVATTSGFLLCAGLPAAADDTGTITITVTDASTHTPLALARVLLDGPIITSELSGQDGKVVFTDVPSGIYRSRVAKNGYISVTSTHFEVLEGRAVFVAVELAKPAVKTLGTITVRSSATVSSTSVNENSAVRKLSDTLADALGKLSGVSVTTDPNGDSDASVTISLEGHDPTQTALTLDGIPMNAPGVAGDLRSINTDLFSSASANFGPSAGALGGSVGFRSIEPTLTWQGKFTTSVGNYGKAATIVSGSGTAGDVGVAFTHAIRGSDSPLAGQTFLDSSGLDYLHEGATQSGGDLFKVRTALGSAQTLSATYVFTNNYNDLLCLRFTGPVPCGFGPGNYSDQHFSLASLTDTALLGEVAMQASLYGTNSTANRNLLNRFVAGIPAPFGTVTDSSSRGATVSATLPSRERHTLSVQATTSYAQIDTAGVLSSSSPFSNAQSSSNYSTVSLNDKIRSSTTLTLGARAGMSFSPQTSDSFIGGASAVWAPTRADTFTGSLDLGGAGAGFTRAVPLTDPAALRFDCNAQAAYGVGPGDPPGPTSSTSWRMGWQRAFRTGQVTATLYRQDQNDVLVNTYVNGEFLPPGYLPPGYLAVAQAIFQSTSGCGTTQPFTATNLFVNQPIANVQRVYQGLQLTGGFRVGQNLVAEPYYNITETIANSTSPLLNNPFSIIIPGAQMPNIPMHRGGLTLDYKAPHSAVEGLLNGTYVSANNANNLPGYVTADAGVAFTMTKGTITAAVTNIFNKYGYYFASPDNAVGLPTVGGDVLPTVARPLQPTQLSITYSVKFGNAPQSNTTPALLVPTVASTGSNGRNGGPGGGGGGFFAALAPLATAPPSHPLDVDTSRQACTPDAAKTVQPLLDQIKAYVAAVDSDKTATGYPASAPANVPVIDGVNVTYHKTDASYALTLTQTKPGSIRNFISCAPVHVGTVDEAKAANLYIPQTSVFSRFPLVYSPEGGLYIVRQQQQQAGQEQFRLYKLPTTPPAQPFAVTAGALCTDEVKPTAVSLLGALQSYFTDFDATKPPAAPPAGWTVTTHKTNNGYWSELMLADISRLPAILYCAHVAAGTTDDVKAQHLDGARPPSINYSPALGIYLMRNEQQGQRPNGGSPNGPPPPSGSPPPRGD